MSEVSHASESEPLSSDGEPRLPCPRCGSAILVGARKCRSCRRWLDGSPEHRPMPWRFAVLGLVAAALGGFAIARRPTTVGEAPPLTPMTPAGSADATTLGEPAPGALGPAPDPTTADSAAATPVAPEAARGWRTRRIHLDAHPLDAVFSDDGNTLLVSGDDGKIRAYDVVSGRRTQILTVPAQGERLKLLHGRYLAVIHQREGAHIPLVDVQTWDREPTLLQTGTHPADVIELPDGKTVLTASSNARKVGWHDVATGRTLATLRLPNETSRLFLLHGHGRAFVGALGSLHQGASPTSAMLEVFDPLEKPFGATRRSVSLGRDPRGGAVTPDGRMLLCADRLANSALLFDTEASRRPVSIPVGQGPTAAFILEGRHGITLDTQARTATVIELETAKRTNTLMLPDTPHSGATSPDGKWLAVTLGGSAFPPTGSGVVIIGESPPRIVARLATGEGATRVSFSRDGQRAVVSCFSEGELTVLER
ncbi:MAG: hypothetical protein FJ096_04695 [Deltaproteobacteria bacterium]|nr:hypothetical protein [Deltaproteobacteria bacterium]